MKDIVISSSVKETFSSSNHHSSMLVAALSPALSSSSTSSSSSSSLSSPSSPASTHRLKAENNSNNNNNNIDTPARMKKEIVFNYFIANKVELVDLESKSNQADKNKTDLTVCLNRASSKTEQPPSRSKQSSAVTSPLVVTTSTTSNSVKKSEKRISIPSVTLSPPPAVKRLSTSFLFYPYSNLAALIMNSEQLSKNGGSGSSTCSSSTSSTASLFDPNKIHLFVKAGQDGRSQGACPFCQDVFMQLLVKAQTNKFNFDVITINMDNPPKEFKELCIKPPVLIHGSTKLIDGGNGSNKKNSDCIEVDSDVSNGGSMGGSNAIVLSDVDEIAEYLDRVYPNSPLIVNNSEAKKVCLNVFSKFSFFIRDVSSKSTSLESELEKIDAYLRDHCGGGEHQHNQRRCFLNGEHMSQLDCSLLPKLQHIRVACESIKRFRIPARFRHLWRYMQHAYQTDAFQKSCPPDREIIWNWAKNILSHRELLQIVQEAPYKTLTITDDVPI